MLIFIFPVITVNSSCFVATTTAVSNDRGVYIKWFLRNPWVTNIFLARVLTFFSGEGGRLKLENSA